MRAALPVLAVWLVGCPPKDSCGLEGDYLGEFEGDEQGQVELVVVPSGDALGELDFRMVGPNLELIGSTVSLDCTTGSFVLELEDVTGQSVGDALGSAGTANGSGEWALFTGTQGTWNY